MNATSPISWQEALNHPYLQVWHDPADEHLNSSQRIPLSLTLWVLPFQPLTIIWLQNVLILCACNPTSPLPSLPLPLLLPPSPSPALSLVPMQRHMFTTLYSTSTLMLLHCSMTTECSNIMCLYPWTGPSPHFKLVRVRWGEVGWGMGDRWGSSLIPGQG